MDILDNVVPLISGKEDKLESEARKILGSFKGTEFTDLSVAISSACNRVFVLNRHASCILLKFGKRPLPEAGQFKEAMRSFV